VDDYEFLEAYKIKNYQTMNNIIEDLIINSFRPRRYGLPFILDVDGVRVFKSEQELYGWIRIKFPEYAKYMEEL